ncbi:hypothetical protein ACN469_11955 [Corallococcus terminator]
MPCLLLGASASAQITRVVPLKSAEQGLAMLGKGYNPVSGQFLAPCVVPSAPKSITNENATISDLEITTVSSEQMMDTLIDLDAHATIRAGGSVEVGASYLHTDNVTRFSVFGRIKATAQRITYSLEEYKLQPWVKETVESSATGKEDFARLCGDQFVAGVISGAEFTGLLRIDTVSEKQKDQIKAKLEADFAAVKAGIKGTVNFENYAKTTNVHANMSRRGGVDALPSLALDDYIKEARRVPELAARNPWPVAVLTVDYSLVSNKPRWNALKFQAQKDIMDQLVADYATLARRLADERFARDNPSQFVPPPDAAALAAHIAALQTNLNLLTKSATRCMDDVNTCVNGGYEMPQPFPLQRVQTTGTEPCFQNDQEACNTDKGCPGTRVCQDKKWTVCATTQPCECRPGTTESCPCEKGCQRQRTCQADFKWGACKCDDCVCDPNSRQDCACPMGCQGGKQTCVSNGQRWSSCVGCPSLCPRGFQQQNGICVATFAAAPTEVAWSVTSASDNSRLAVIHAPSWCRSPGSRQVSCELRGTLNRAEPSKAVCKQNNETAMKIFCDGQETGVHATEFQPPRNPRPAFDRAFACGSSVEVWKGTGAYFWDPTRGCLRTFSDLRWSVELSTACP